MPDEQTTSETPPTETQDTAPATGTPPGKQAEPPAARTFSQAEVDEIVKGRLERAKTQAQKDAEKARSEAEAKALEDGAQWQKLAEKRAGQVADLEKRIAELEAGVEPAKRNAAALQKHVEAQLAGVPEHIKALLTRMDAAEQLEWLSANADKLTAQSNKVVPATPESKDKPAGKMTAEERREVAARLGVNPNYLPQ